MIIDCPICGKLTCIHWPQFWPYVRGTAYYCSWTCMDVSLCRDMNLIKAADMRKRSKKNMKTIVTKEQKQKAVSMAIDGRDPRPYLKECGSSNPDNLWWYIKSTLKKNNPELYAKVMDQRKIEKKPEEVPVVKVDGPIRIETPEKNKVEVVETPEGPVKGPVTPDELYEKFTNFHTVKNVSEVEADMPERFCRYTAIDTPIGEFHYDRRHGYLDWDWDNNTMSLNTEEWKEFMKWFPYALERLGVEL